jgi:uncharacterized membrane protein YraQ (UPF0718 family)
MKDKILSFLKEYTLEIIISLIAVTLLILNPQKAYLGIKNAFFTYLNLLLVMVSVAFLAGFISEVIPKEMIKKILGKESGIKGILIGAILGTLMVGPAYAFYPFFKEMISKGARVSVIATTIGAWAIKVPWIPFAIALLGLKYVLLLNFLVFIYAIISGLIVEYFVNLK